VPEPFATLLLQATAQRDNLQTATNPAGRTAALRQLVLQAPAPVVAQALGYHHHTTTRVATEAGTPWSRYAASQHDH
jgi:hypothetical protein